MQSSTTTPLCGYCGRPVGFGDQSRMANGVMYHFECTRPPKPTGYHYGYGQSPAWTLAPKETDHG